MYIDARHEKTDPNTEAQTVRSITFFKMKVKMKLKMKSKAKNENKTFQKEKSF